MGPLLLSRRRMMLTAAATGAALAVPGIAPAKGRIDRKALVTRHNPVLHQVDPHAPLMLGNGNIGFTADITGLQTFTEPYSKIAPLLTEAQWAWHSFPNPDGHTVRDTQVELPVAGHTRRYGYIKDWADAAKNPHRFSLGRLALDLRARDGSPARFGDIRDTQQTLDLWTGTLTSRFVYDGEAVKVVTRVLPGQDTIMAELSSALVAQGRLGVAVRFPGVSKTLNPDPSDWNNPGAHTTTEVSRKAGVLRLRRQVDATTYHAAIGAPGATIEPSGPHAYRVATKVASLSVMLQFSEQTGAALPTLAAGAASVARHWNA